MNIGFYISGIGHALVIGWAFFGGIFRSEPFPFEDVQVSVISGEEFAALTAQPIAPNVVTDTLVPVAPEIGETPNLPQLDEPEPTEAAAPPQPQQPDEQPDTDVSVPMPPPEPEVADMPADRPGLEQTDVVSDQNAEPAEPEVDVADQAQEAVTPDDAGDVVAEEQQETTVEQGGPQIVTEAEAGGAPDRSLRPQIRPARPDPPAVAQEDTPSDTPDEETETASNDTSIDDAVNAVLGEAVSDTSSGPPMTPGETEGLRLAVQECWNIGALGTDSLQVVVVVGFSMEQTGSPVGDSVRLISASGGNDAAVSRAYEAARRAILRCGARGYNLPPEKYDHWKEIEITFDPTRMGIR